MFHLGIRISSRGGFLLRFALFCSLMAGCQGVSIRRIGGGPSLSSAGRRERIDRRTDPDPDNHSPPPAIRGSASFDPNFPHSSDSNFLLARANASHRAGLNARKESREIDARYQVDAIADASGVVQALTSGPSPLQVDPRISEAVALHGAAQSEFLRATGGRSVRLDEDWRSGLLQKGIRLTIARDSEFLSPESFDRFLFVDDFAIRNLDRKYRSEGVGVPLIALRKFDLKKLEKRTGEEKFLMPRQVYPMTAVVKLEPPAPGPGVGPYGLRLELHDPLVEKQVAVGGRALPLAADVTTPLVYHFAQSPLPILQEVGLLDPQWLEKIAGLYMLHPYERGKIPVVLVHGLRSSPIAWMKVINDLRGDPSIRDRYQFWIFMYPTGTPFPISAAKLRKGLDELRDTVDPDRRDPALDRIVMVGHSMGGLITRMMIARSEDEIWKLVGRRPFEELKASDEHKEMLRRVFFFEPHQSIARAVFIATPHRGSELGDKWIGRLADRLIRMPLPLRMLSRRLIAQNGAEFFTSEIREGGLPSSIDELRTDNRLLKTLAKLERKPIPAHSIIGQTDPGLPVEEGSDGVVAYTSSHLDWASSEFIVRGDHGCQDETETIRELRRILYLHLGEYSLTVGPAEPIGSKIPPDHSDENRSLPDTMRSLNGSPE